MKIFERIECLINGHKYRAYAAWIDDIPSHTYLKCEHCHHTPHKGWLKLPSNDKH